MASKTTITELVRKKKRTLRGKDRKKANAKAGTTNYMTAFGKPAPDAPKRVKELF